MACVWLRFVTPYPLVRVRIVLCGLTPLIRAPAALSSGSFKSKDLCQFCHPYVSTIQSIPSTLPMCSHSISFLPQYCLNGTNESVVVVSHSLDDVPAVRTSHFDLAAIQLQAIDP